MKGGRIQVVDIVVVLLHGLNCPVGHDESTKPFKNKSDVVTLLWEDHSGNSEMGGLERKDFRVSRQ